METVHTEINLENTSTAFATKSDAELNNSFWLFRLLKSSALVKIFSNLTLLGLKIRLPINSIIKKTIFKQFCGGENIVEAEKEVSNLKRANIGSILDYSVEGKNTTSDFVRTKDEVLRIIKLAEANPAIPYTSLKVTGIAPYLLLEKLSADKELNASETKEYDAAFNRLEEICLAAYHSNVPIYFDAEESWVQQAIDTLAEYMMQKYNKHKAIVLTTLQMYRTDRKDYLTYLIEKAQQEKLFIGIKLVRGAYLEKENKRASDRGYPSPVHITKERTDEDFNSAITICLESRETVSLCAGTHNEASTFYLLHEMHRLGIANDDERVYFSQLFGMSDHITYNLAEANYNVTKYLPYGPIKAVVPYLIRRAQENTAIGGQMSRELKLILEEKKRRSVQRLLH